MLNGRYGPYISNREKNARAPKDRDPKTLTLEECRALLAAAPVRPMRGRGRFGNRKGAPGKTATAAAGTASAASSASKTPPAAKKRAAARKPAGSVAPTALAARSTAQPKVKSVAASPAQARDRQAADRKVAGARRLRKASARVPKDPRRLLARPERRR